ncbi:hypothetical protein [Chromobacterium amazonense]|uniref:hypothetical protein n=1 Tax=Chromobacterium amazonense TaxID=1382803 RepID=UPI00166FC9ED|nr:hypothetical protein [Chromobacterium amazonense]
MGIPQWIYLGMSCVSIGIELQRHGQACQGRHNFIGALLGQGILTGLLYWGGFFTGV